MSVARQCALVSQADPARSVQARCQALGLSRSSFYYQLCGEIAYNLELMRRLMRLMSHEPVYPKLRLSVLG